MNFDSHILSKNIKSLLKLNAFDKLLEELHNLDRDFRTRPKNVDSSVSRVLKECIFCQDDMVVAKAIYLYMYVFRIHDFNVENQIMKWYLSSSADYDVRLWCGSGLAELYGGTKNTGIMRYFHDASRQLHDGFDAQSLVYMLRVFGLEWINIYSRITNYSYSISDVLREFKNELNVIQRMLNV